MRDVTYINKRECKPIPHDVSTAWNVHTIDIVPNVTVKLPQGLVLPRQVRCADKIANPTTDCLRQHEPQAARARLDSSQLVSLLVSTLSPVNHKGLHQG